MLKPIGALAGQGHQRGYATVHYIHHEPLRSHDIAFPHDLMVPVGIPQPSTNYEARCYIAVVLNSNIRTVICAEAGPSTWNLLTVQVVALPHLLGRMKTEGPCNIVATCLAKRQDA